jgi:amino acid adenylation domain-containing protein
VERRILPEMDPGSPTVPRLQDFLRASAARLPEKIALVAREQRLSYGRLAADAERLARALVRRGIGKGDRVLVFCENRPEAVTAFWGILCAGAIAVPVSPLTKSEKLRWLLANCRASALIADERLRSVFAPAAAQTPTLKTILAVAGPRGAVSSPCDDFATALADESPGPFAAEVHPHDLAALIYTSGSTGRPKGVMLTHANMVSAADAIATYLGLGEHDVVHGIMPLSFDYGLYQALLTARHGARLVLAPPFTLPGQVLKQAAAEGVTFFPGVPTVFAILGELRELSAWDLRCVRAVTSTAAVLHERHIAAIRQVFPAARIFSMYGLTECKRCTYLPPEDLARKPGSVGIAIPNTELWLEGADGVHVGPNEVGELMVRGPTVMQGYWENPEATAEMLRPGPGPGANVLRTGDLFRRDDEGYFYFVGRQDDIIKSRGEKVAPKEVELVLTGIAGVKEAAVIGVPDPLLGQAIKAFVAPEPGAVLSERELLGECRAALESFMVPRAIEILSALPKSPNGKIDKRALAASGS